MDKHLLALLEVCDVQHDFTFPSILQATQKAWLRPIGKERWEMEEKDFGPEKNQAIRDLAKKMGFIEEIIPVEKQFRYCLLHGCVLPQFQLEVAYAAELWAQGVRYDEVVLLGGDRPLNPIADQFPGLQKYATSLEGLRLVFETTHSPLQNLPLLVVNAPTPPACTRPTTSDTILAFLAKNPSPGPCIFISRQPFVLYQDSVARALMPKSFAITTAGPGISESSLSIAVLLDSIARYLYQKKSL